MKRHKNLLSLFNQKGFSHIELFLAIIFIGVIAFVGDRVLTRSNAASNCTVNTILVNSCHPLLGAFAVDYPGLSSLTGLPQVQGEEQRTGAHLDVVHTDYHRAGDDQLTSEEHAIATGPSNQTVYLNWKPAPNWSEGDGGNSTVQKEINTMAASVKAVAPRKIFITIWHEPGNDVSASASTATCKGKGSAGTPAQFRAMWANVEDQFKKDGVNNVVWAILFQEYPPVACWDQALYPGNSLVDWIGFDTYGNGGTGDSFQRSAGAGYQYLQKLSGEAGTSTAGWMSKPVVLGELGSCRAAYSSQENADYWADAKASLDKNLYPDIQLYMIFDAPGSGFTNPAGQHYPGGCMVGYTQNGKSTDSVQQNAYNAFANDKNFTSGTSPTPPPPSKNPVINNFSATPATIKPGATSKLSWSTTNVKNCTLTPGGPQNTTSTSWTTPALTATGAHTYTLSCQNNTGKTSATTKVTVSNITVSSTTGYLCTSSTSCASLPANGTATGAETIAVISKASAWKWDQVPAGTVTSSWPFTNSTLAKYYSGDKVVQYVLHNNNGYCLANSGTSVLLRACDKSVPALAPQLWVLSGNWRVNPAASDNNSAKYVLTNSSGTAVDALGVSGATRQNWTFGD